jgi:hypothetical protein
MISLAILAFALAIGAIAAIKRRLSNRRRREGSWLATAIEIEEFLASWFGNQMPDRGLTEPVYVRHRRERR